MRDSPRTAFSNPQTIDKEFKPDDTAQSRVFNNLRNRASNAIPSINLASLRARAFGATNPKDGDGSLRAGSRLASDHESRRLVSISTDLETNDDLSRRRSRSTPPDGRRQTLRSRAKIVKSMAFLDLKARAHALDLSRLPSFHFSLPFSDSTPDVETRDDAFDNMLDLRQDSDNISLSSLTSLEMESLATNMKAENNRLRGLIEGLPIPRLGIPGINLPEDRPFAGLSKETKDLNIVILGGYRGSVLRSAQDNRMLWIPVKVGLGIRKVDLELPLDTTAEENASKSIVPDTMLSNIGPVDISKRLFKKLREMEEKGYCKVHDYGYDWRLGGQFLSDALITYLERLPGKALVIAHSLGGLITTHAMNRRPDLFQGVLYAGTPFAGCPNILGPFRYGDGVLLNKDILNARTNFSMRSSFMLLPTHKRCFVDIETGKELPIDFFDPESWIEYGLSPEVAKDHGAGDRGEAAEINGMIASGGVGGPSLGNSTENDKRTATSAQNRSNDTSPTRPGARKASDADDPNRIKSVLTYLDRTLKSTLQFKSELCHNPEIKYPPLALLRSNTTPTVRGCSVLGYQGVKEGDYSKFIFSPGDGVVTYASSDIRTFDTDGDSVNGFAKYVVRNVENDRGHIGLLGDLKGVEMCLSAILLGIKRDQENLALLAARSSVASKDTAESKEAEPISRASVPSASIGQTRFPGSSRAVSDALSNAAVAKTRSGPTSSMAFETALPLEPRPSS